MIKVVYVGDTVKDLYWWQRVVMLLSYIYFIIKTKKKVRIVIHTIAIIAVFVFALGLLDFRY